MVTVSFSIFGDKQVERKLMRMGDSAADLSPAFRLIADDFLAIERRQFDSDGVSGSGGWAPLKPSTIRQKVAKGQDAEHILRATNALYDSLTSESAPGHVSQIDSTGFFIGTSDPKAAYHQRGTSRMPQRKVVELTETDRRRWVRIIQRQLIEGSGDSDMGTP